MFVKISTVWGGARGIRNFLIDIRTTFTHIGDWQFLFNTRKRIYYLWKSTTGNIRIMVTLLIHIINSLL